MGIFAVKDQHVKSNIITFPSKEEIKSPDTVANHHAVVIQIGSKLPAWPVNPFQTIKIKHKLNTILLTCSIDI